MNTDEQGFCGNQYLLFAYGTLRRGGSNHFRMESGEYVGSGVVSGKMYLIDWDSRLVYPGLVCGGDDRVRGDLFLVGEDCLWELDQFEGEDYRRVEVEVSVDDGSKRMAWLWEWQGELEGARFLEDGDWMNHEPDPK